MLKKLTRLSRLTLALAGVSLVVACGPKVAHPVGTPFDPFEAENRKMHEFNKSVDRALVRPAGKGYTEIVPDDIENAVGRFSKNLSIPSSIVNNVLQANMKGATEDFYRFLVNSTIGLGGVFDPATELNMPAATDADFGQTMHVWGVPQGAYVTLPFLGPSTERDAVGKFVDLFTNPLSYILPTPESYYGTGASVASSLSDRGRYADTLDSILYESADSYAAARSLYLQNRAYELGKLTGDSYADPYDDPYGTVFDLEDPYDE
jgi:phospholipid-binding lipoprotein MlaA